MLHGTAGTAVRVAEWEMDEPHGMALEHRGLDVEMAVRLGWRPCAGPSDDDLWIAIPIIEGGKRVGTKRRTITGAKRFIQDVGTPQIFYNVDCLSDPALGGYPLIITEGEMDALAALQCGFPKTVSVPGGAPEHDDGDDGPRWQYLVHAQNQLAQQRPIILATDADPNGRVLQAGLARRLGRSRCQILEYPTGKDLNDVLLRQGVDALRRTVGAAQYMPLTGLMRLHEIPEQAPKRALDTCIPGLEPHLRIRRGDLIVVTGPPGHGKSSFVANLCCNMAWHWKAVIAISSMEQAIVPDLRRILRSYRAECLEKFMGDQQRVVADEWIDRHFIFVQATENEDMTLPWLLERFSAASERYGAGIVVIDPWNEVSVADKPVDWTTEQWVSQSLRLIKSWARTHDAAVIIVAHPRKMGRDRNGKVPKPTLWDIADSAAWANRCDAGVVIYRPDLMVGNRTEISVEKSRDYYAIGTPGMVTLQWEAETSRFVRPGGWHA
jgi:twinkle protein